MLRRLIFGSVLMLMLVISMAFAVPASRYPLLGWIRGERLFEGRPVSFWISALKDDDASTRRQAALVLGDVCQDASQDDPDCGRTIPALLETLGDADGFVRKCAATSFILSPREAAVPQDQATIQCLTGALADREVAVRQAAVRALWQAGAVAKEADGVTRLREALRDKDDFVRMYAARALARIGPDAKDAVPTLLQRLRQDEERDVRKLSAKTLGLIGARAIGPQLPETVQVLSAALKDEYPGLREYAARSLGQLGAKEAIAPLQEIRQDKDEQVRAAAVEAIQRLEALSAEKSP